MRPLEQLVTLSDKESSGGGRQLGSVVWSPEGPPAIASTDGRRICIWSLQESDSSVANLSGCADAPGAISACCWGGPPGVARLVSSSNGSIHAWDPRTLGGSPATVAVARAHGGAAVLSLDCNPLKPHQVLSGGADLLIKCWDVRNGREPVLTLSGHSHWATSARYNPSHDQLVLSGSTDHTVRVLTVHAARGAVATSDMLLFCLSNGRFDSGERRLFRWSRLAALPLRKRTVQERQWSKTTACGCACLRLQHARLPPACSGQTLTAAMPTCDDRASTITTATAFVALRGRQVMRSSLPAYLMTARSRSTKLDQQKKTAFFKVEAESRKALASEHRVVCFIGIPLQY